MLKIKIVTIGKKSPAPILQLCQEYEKRLSKSYHIEWIILPGAQGKMNINAQKDHESRSISSALNDRDLIVVLDEKGAQLSNQLFADNFSEWRQSGKTICFVIGGSYGVTEELISKAHFVWSFSRLVFTHEIVRLILIEQLYRTQTIIDGLPYHHK